MRLLFDDTVADSPTAKLPEMIEPGAPTDPIDYMVFNEGTGPRINLIFETLSSPERSNHCAVTLVTAAKLANKLNIPLRVISRNNPSNAKCIYSCLESHNVKLPTKLEFYNDCTRNQKDFVPHKLLITEEDCFLAPNNTLANVAAEICMQTHCFCLLHNSNALSEAKTNSSSSRTNILFFSDPTELSTEMEAHIHGRANQ